MEITKYKTLISLELHLSTDMKMEALEQSLSPLNWNLLMSGCPLFKSTNKYIRLVVGGYGCLIVIATIIRVLHYVLSPDVPESYSALLILVFKLWFVFFQTISASTVLLIWSARKGLQRILNRISTLLSNEDRKQLYFLSLVLFIYKMLFVLIWEVPYLWSLYVNRCGSWCEGWWPFLFSIVRYSIKFHEWELITFSILVTLLKAIHLAEKNVMNILGQNLEKVGPKVLYRQLHELLSLKNYFVECVSFLPLFLYCYVFMESVGCIVMLYSNMNNPSVSNGQRLYAVLLNTRNIVIVGQNVLLTLYIHHLSCQSRSQLRNIEYQINTKHDHLLKRNVMLLIQEAKAYEYRAADFFVINKELLLSFFSAFVTFTVLFVQLINQSK